MAERKRKIDLDDGPPSKAQMMVSDAFCRQSSEAHHQESFAPGVDPTPHAPNLSLNRDL
jgi:hypothetical protein